MVDVFSWVKNHLNSEQITQAQWGICGDSSRVLRCSCSGGCGEAVGNGMATKRLLMIEHRELFNVCHSERTM